MQPLFYHDRRRASACRSLCATAVVAIWCLSAVSCERRATGPERTATPVTSALPAAPPSQKAVPPVSATADAISRGRAIMDRMREAGGGPTLTALRSFEATGTSTMTGMKVARNLKVQALFPLFFRQAESTPAGLKGPTFNTTIGLQRDLGWLTGALIGGDGQSKDLEVSRRTYARAARQAMAGFVAGISAPWLADTGAYTITDGGRIDAGTDRGALVLIFDGPDGRVGRLLIDPDTRLPRRLIQPPQPGSGGTAAVADIVFTYSDYQPQGGLQLPHTIVRENGRNRTVWSITQFVVNPRLTARQFSRAQR